MISTLRYQRPERIDEALGWLAREPGAQLLAGGQSLLVAAKLGLTRPSHLIDLQRIAELKAIRIERDTIWLGAMVTHARVATDPDLAMACPWLAALAAGIADQQVRHRGTIGGSIALNDPSACWPAGVLAAGATIVTTAREIAADEFFTGLFATALMRNEIIVGVRFAKDLAGAYLKSEQKASRFALVGVAVTRSEASVRVAITGLGHGVTRWPAAETRLATAFDPHALLDLALDPSATADLHASAEYREHLARVLTVRAVARLAAITAPRVPFLAKALENDSTTKPATPGAITGEQRLDLPIDAVWRALHDPSLMQRAIPGCESIEMRCATDWQASIKVGLGFIAARFATQIRLHDTQSPPGGAGHRTAALRLTVIGHAGALGSGEGQATVSLAGDEAQTTLTWSVTPDVRGHLAQLGSRMMQATAHKLSREFFERLGVELGASPAPVTRNRWQRALAGVKAWLARVFARQS